MGLDVILLGRRTFERHRQVVDLVWWLRGLVVAIAARYKGYRYPIEVIGHAVWLYHRFALSLRDVEELMLARGVLVTYETIRSWCAKFGPDYAAQLRRRRPRPGDKWHFDEVFVTINGTTHYLWRAVDRFRRSGYLVDVTSTRTSSPPRSPPTTQMMTNIKR
jgi:transposase-like protein